MEEMIEMIDPEGARLAFENLAPLLDTQSELRRTNVDRDRAAIVAAAIGRKVKQPEVRALFEVLPAEHFDLAHVDRLEPAALATWHASVMLRSASAQRSSAQVPEAVLATATTVKRRMMRVVEYHLGDDPVVGIEIADVRAGNGHLDLATDLMRLARLYETNGEILAVDTRYYRVEDVAEARRLGSAIHQLLGDGMPSDAAYWANYQARAWTLLLDTYDEVSAAGRWLFRKSNGEQRFPSLFVASRQPRRTGNPAQDPLPGDPDPAEPGGGNSLEAAEPGGGNSLEAAAAAAEPAEPVEPPAE